MIGFWILGGLGALILIVCALFDRKNYKRGFDEGYARGEEYGRLKADNWWLGAEEGTDQARQEIWRKGV